MRKILVAFAAILMGLAPMGFVSGVADAQPDHNRPCENWPADHPVMPTHPLCDEDGNFLPPGLGGDNPGCDHANPGSNPNCPDEGNGGNGGNGENGDCPPGTGPVSGVVQQISEGFRDGGGAPIADVIDTVNCEIIVGVLGL